jgi:sarcosine oxidase subunit gamma
MTGAIERSLPLLTELEKGRHGGPFEGEPPLRLEVRHPLSMVTLIARLNQAQALSAAIEKAYGAPLPQPRRSTTGHGVAFQWCGDQQYYAVAENRREGALCQELKTLLSGLASVSDQSHGRVVIRITGPKARPLLAKGSPVDFHPRAFPVGAAAPTQMAHIGVHVVRIAQDRYEVSLFRGFSESFWEWLTQQAQEFGYEIE